MNRLILYYRRTIVNRYLIRYRGSELSLARGIRREALFRTVGAVGTYVQIEMGVCFYRARVKLVTVRDLHEDVVNPALFSVSTSMPAMSVNCFLL